MSVYIRWGGLGLLLLCALAVNRGYREYIGKRVRETESLLRLLCHMESRISGYLAPIADAVSGFCDDNLEKAGFFSEYSACRRLSDAFSAILPRLSVGKETVETVMGVFDSLGGYKDEVLSSLGKGIKALEKVVEEEKNSLPKNEKVASAVLTAASLGIFILLV